MKHLKTFENFFNTEKLNESFVDIDVNLHSIKSLIEMIKMAEKCINQLNNIKKYNISFKDMTITIDDIAQKFMISLEFNYEVDNYNYDLLEAALIKQISPFNKYLELHRIHESGITIILGVKL